MTHSVCGWKESSRIIEGLHFEGGIWSQNGSEEGMTF